MLVALSNLIVDDRRLLTAWVPTRGPGSERAIAAALGWHIKAIMERRWDVDCEYNRAGADRLTAVKRRHSPSAVRIAGVGQGQSTVTPDLIVHRRGLHGRSNNLLVVELKTGHDDRQPTARTSRGSLQSILDIQQQFEYQHAVLLNLQLHRQGPTPDWVWVELADPREAELQPQDVYETASLHALCRRGQLADDQRYSAQL